MSTNKPLNSRVQFLWADLCTSDNIWSSTLLIFRFSFGSFERKLFRIKAKILKILKILHFKRCLSPLVYWIFCQKWLYFCRIYLFSPQVFSMSKRDMGDEVLVKVGFVVSPADIRMIGEWGFTKFLDISSKTIDNLPLLFKLKWGASTSSLFIVTSYASFIIYTFPPIVHVLLRQKLDL